MKTMKNILETKNLILRSFTTDDTETLTRIFSDSITMQFWPKPLDRSEVQKWIQDSIDSYQISGMGRLAVILKSTGECIGDCGLRTSEINGVKENDLGYILDKKFWGHGYATEAAEACLHYGFETLELKRVVANMETRHIASKRVAEKIGLQIECEFINRRNRNLPTFLLSKNI
jgi:ribosomal-protein-alanine N-acetyltransferase